MMARDIPRKWLFSGLAALFLVIGGAAWLGWAWGSQAGPANVKAADRAAIEAVVRDYILAHPEILPEAMDVLQQRENAKQLTGVRDDLEKPFPGAILGNPAGGVTLVEFTDFACTYCRQSVMDVETLVRRNADLRVVVRELPILSPQSAAAARMGLAAAEQGKYAAFHKLMFAAGRPDDASIEAAARAAGLDMERARAFAAGPKVAAELERNMNLARQLGFNGTPSWVIGNEVISGAVGIERLEKAVSRARS